MRIAPAFALAAFVACCSAPLAQAVAPASPAGCDRRTATVQVQPDLRVPAGESDAVQLAVSGLAGTITDVDLHVATVKYSPADLTLALVAPDGTRVLLSDPTTGSVWQDAGYPMWDVLWDDQAAASITSEPAPVEEGSNPLRPAQPLTGLAGRAANGTWRLTIGTTADGSSGVFDDVTLTVTTCVRAAGSNAAAGTAPAGSGTAGSATPLPTTGAAPVPGDVRPPRVHWSIAPTVGLAGQLRRPIITDVRVDEASVIVAELRLTPGVARSLHLPALVSTTAVATPAAGARRLVLRFTPKLRAALATRNGVNLVVRLRITDSSGNTRTAAKPLHLQR